MKKLIDGIIDFRKSLLPCKREQFAELAKGQHPDALFITCSDSRVAPNWFASTNPGDLFVVRNMGNMIPACQKTGVTSGDVSELAAVEFAVLNLRVADIIVCGHSECGAMHALTHATNLQNLPHLKSWLANGQSSLKRFEAAEFLDDSLSRVNQLSQMNVLQQIDNLMTHPLIAERCAQNQLQIHGWWFDIAKADVYRFNNSSRRFEIIDN